MKFIQTIVIIIMTHLCNAKVKFIRPKYANFREVLADTNNVYIGRHGRIFIDKKIFNYIGSIWANPYKVGRDGDLTMVLAKYKTYILQKIKDEKLQTELEQLKSKYLYCWCVPKTIAHSDECGACCHGQVILDLIQDI